MPILLNDDGSLQAAGAQPKAQAPQYSPKDYNSVLTGNGINQGLLRSSLTLSGNGDIIPPHVVTTILQHKYECMNRAYHEHDQSKSFTVLMQDISICGEYAYQAGGFNSVQHITLPMNLFTDHFMTFENPATGAKAVFRSRIFLKRIDVYKAVNNYVLPCLFLVAVDENNPAAVFVAQCEAIASTPVEKDPVGRVFDRVAAQVKYAVANEPSYNGFVLTIDDSAALAAYEKTRSMYDAIMDELALIKTPGTLKYVLEALSATGISALGHANEVLSRINIPFALYQSDVVDVVNSRPANEAKSLKNGNMSLSLADTLSAMKGQAGAVIPELTGKHYKTNAIALTNEQLAAIETDSKITIVAAGAGTGKSSCIMHRLAFMEENGCDMKQTFVLSFTKAAAGHIKKNFKDCKSSTIAEFTHNFVDIILDDGSGTRVDIISHSDFVQKLTIRAQDLTNAKILAQSTADALNDFIYSAAELNKPNGKNAASKLLDMLDISMNSEANNLISILKMLHCTSLELDPIIFHSQLSMLKPNIEHIVIDESQDSNRLEFLTMLKMAMQHGISVYIVGDCAQTLYEFRDADPRILNNLTKLFNTFDLSINHRSTQIILDVANLMSNTMSTHKTTLKANNIMHITQQAIDDTVTINTYSKVQDPATIKTLDDYIEKHIGQGESIAVIARSGNDVQKLFEYLSMRYGGNYEVQNITSQRRNDITILSAIGDRLPTLFPAGKAVSSWAEFEYAVRAENIKINSVPRKANPKYTQNGPQVNKVTDDWLAAKQADGPAILAGLNGSAADHDAMIRKLQLSLLDAQTEKNNTLQRVMDAKNAKLKTVKADIVVCTVHGVKGLEYDHVACFINTEAGRSYSSSNSDENKRIAYVALTRAKLTECVFCTREKLLKDFEAYRAAQPVGVAAYGATGIAAAGAGAEAIMPGLTVSDNAPGIPDENDENNKNGESAEDNR